MPCWGKHHCAGWQAGNGGWDGNSSLEASFMWGFSHTVSYYDITIYYCWELQKNVIEEYGCRMHLVPIVAQK